MAPLLIVLADAEMRKGLSDALLEYGRPLIEAQGWFDVPSCVEETELAAVLFRCVDVGWKAGLAHQRNHQPGLLAIAVGAKCPDPIPPPRCTLQQAGVTDLAGSIERLLVRSNRAATLKAALDALHVRVLQGDSRAREEFCQLALVEVRRQFRWRREDMHCIDAAIDAALARHSRQPDRYDPTRGHPIAFIKKMAKDSLADELRAVRRRALHEVPVGVRYDLVAGGADPAAGSASVESQLVEQRRFLLAVARTDAERAFLECWLDDPRHDRLAQVLGVQHLPDPAQRLAVHAMQERLRQRAKRALARRGGAGRGGAGRAARAGRPPNLKDCFNSHTTDGYAIGALHRTAHGATKP